MWTTCSPDRDEQRPDGMPLPTRAPPRSAAPAPRRDAPAGRHLPRHRHPRRPRTARPPRLLDGARDVERLAGVAAPRSRLTVAARRRPRRAALGGRDLRRDAVERRAATRSRCRGPPPRLRGDDLSRLRHRQTYGLAIHSDAAAVGPPRSPGRCSLTPGVTGSSPTIPTCCRRLVAAAGHTVSSTVQAGLDHLSVVIDRTASGSGPSYVLATPCMSCHDLPAADWDRAWPLW